jgi:hypothetical protein
VALVPGFEAQALNIELQRLICAFIFRFQKLLTEPKLFCAPSITRG